MTKEEIKENVNMPDVLSQYGISVIRGMCKCPFHDDKKPSMKVYRDGVHCFTCSKNWDVFAFVMDYDHCDFSTAFKRLGGSVDKSKNSEIYQTISKDIRASRGNQRAIPDRETHNEQIKRWTEEIRKESDNLLRALRICQDADLITEIGSEEWHYLKSVQGYIEEMIDNYFYDWRVVQRVLDKFAGRKKRKQRNVEEYRQLTKDFMTLKELEDEIFGTCK